MTELIGDPCKPSSFVLPNIANASLPSTGQVGEQMFDITNGKIVFWNGAAWETVTSAV